VNNEPKGSKKLPNNLCLERCLTHIARKSLLKSKVGATDTCFVALVQYFVCEVETWTAISGAKR
jgi:hypothetical protein